MSEPAAAAYEKLGAFYLGRRIDRPDGDPTDELVLYDSKDLTTHAIIVGMTGSGKTGLAVGLLEEAGIDGVPAIAIDVKGDLTNLLLTFPDLLPSDFKPWIDPAAASRKGKSADEFAASTAAMWRDGLQSWGQDGSRIQRFRDAVDVKLYTPGSTSGTPVSLLDRLDAPPPEQIADADGLRDRIMGAVSALLTLLGRDADPVQSREHIFLSNLIDHAWRAGQDLTLPDLIRAIQAPPFTSVGVIDLESFYPAKDRMALAMLVNNLLASPSFQSWRQGEPLNVASMLQDGTGKPRLSVLYIAHLSDAERMFFVTRLLNDMVSWMRSQSGTGSLRALLYMDEVFGYFPPSANPPSKRPLLTLMKQARAFGVGVVLATQNPVDIDYKGLSNAGTWMLGRLQTERDKMRVLDGLEGVQAASGGGFDRSEMDTILSGLGKRRFVLHNVNEPAPVLFQTRWVMSYLAGPLTLTQLKGLYPDDAPAPSAPVRAGATPTPTPGGPAETGVARPILPAGVEERFAMPRRFVSPGAEMHYRPRLLGAAQLHYVNASWKIDTWQELTLLGALDERRPWDEAERFRPTDWSKTPVEGVGFAALPAPAQRAASFADWEKQLKARLYKEDRLSLFRVKTLSVVSEPGESEADFRSRIRLLAHEARDQAVESLRSKYTARIKRLSARVETAEERLARESAQYQEHKFSTALNIGTTLLGAFLGRRTSTTLTGASRAARGFGRAGKEKEDISVAEDKLKAAQEEVREIEQELAEEVALLRASYEPEALAVETRDLAPRKSDIRIDKLTLAWIPWVREGDGSEAPAV